MRDSKRLKRTILSGFISGLFTGLWIFIVLTITDFGLYPYMLLNISLIIGGSVILITGYVWNNTQAIAGLLIFLLGFTALVINLIQHHPFTAAPTADFILIGGLIVSGLATLLAGKASLFIGGFLLLGTWFVWNFAPVPQQQGEGDIWYRASLLTLAFLFIILAVIIRVYRKR